jgi:hypothetical protein
MAMRSCRFPVLTEVTAMIASYLTAERDLGRIAADADVDTLAPTLIGAGHLLFGRPESHPGRSRPQGRDHGHRRRRTRTAAMNGRQQAGTRGSGTMRGEESDVPPQSG